MEIHKKEGESTLKYICNSCGAAYARGFALKDHIRESHENFIEDSAQIVSNQTIRSIQNKASNMIKGFVIEESEFEDEEDVVRTILPTVLPPEDGQDEEQEFQVIITSDDGNIMDYAIQGDDIGF